MEKVLARGASERCRERAAAAPRALCPRLAGELASSLVHLSVEERGRVERRLHRGGRLRAGVKGPALVAAATGLAAFYFFTAGADALIVAVATCVFGLALAATAGRVRMRARRREFQARLEAWVRREGGREMSESLDAGTLSLADIYERAGGVLFAGLDARFTRFCGEVGAPEFRTDCEPFGEEASLIERMREVVPEARFRVARVRTLFAKGRGELSLVGAERDTEGLGSVTRWYYAVQCGDPGGRRGC